MSNFPFAGTVERPYDQARLTGVDWYAIEARRILFTDLWLTQTHLNIEGVFGKRFSTDSFPRAVLFQGRHYLEDGHHRLVLAAHCLGALGAHIRVLGLAHEAPQQ